MRLRYLALMLLGAFAFITPLQTAHAENPAIYSSVVANQGYDLVSYFKDAGPKRGDTNFISYHKGVTYIFASIDNKKEFEADPAKFIPAYGGYCAVGVKHGKKLISDPLSYKVVDGTLYLNLNKRVQSIWEKDIPGNINQANDRWADIEDKLPSEL